ncbi:uncharacterized protein MICPUCDRAFT_69863 [Micromonas pusilla CCMP1545]|uniref:Predicted protein n=1 Tax=Micromonas pusilla (strain CCMP1545) TaxID=564608 RepID=C1N2J8_MICPC|nr:uncharacterized protein MICPUCDRAFT_69863 [Micromonas pusilla CCMP1545]EEH53598.1 predicted protein [Micromonas pusilla CCMP1545]|eukprot:XP_003061886.1 predicted protein [Micromonas pusilla CCMP1545]
MSSAALSLKCNVCGVQLRSVAEAQSHGEATGHADFAESTEAVLNLSCVTCGKPCRSETERELHSKRTGHSEFVDKTSETSQAVDTEREMKQLEAETREELGLPAKKQKEDGDGADAATESAMDVDENENENEEERVEPEVDAALVAEIEAMGFTRNKAVRAIHTTGTTSVEQAVNWIVEHAEDVELIEDRPLVVAKSKSKPKPKLSKEEAKAKAEELRKTMAAKKEKEEKELERLREQERIRSGKELLAAKRKEEELQTKRNLEARRIEKQEVARAKAKILEKLEEDKLGLPEELTEEEKARERQRAEEKAAAAKEEQRKKAEAGLVVKPVTAVDDLRKILVEIKKTHKDTNDEGVTTCFKTLLVYLGNVMKDPEDAKFRTIKLANGAFQKRVQSVGGDAFLRRVGFEDDGETLAMPREKVDRVLINLAGAEINSALSNPFFGVL